MTDYLSSIYSLTSQIAALKEKARNPVSTQAQTQEQTDPETFLLEMQQSFNDMLSNLVSDSDKEEKNKSHDPFAGFLSTTYQDTTSLYAQLLNNQGLSTNTNTNLDFIA